MRHLPLPTLLLICFFFHYCTLHSDIEDSSQSQLTFSNDTICFDTVFTTIGSVTKYVKVINHHRKDIVIQEIKLKSNNSYFHLNIDGISSNHLNNLTIPPKDSIYIFINVMIDTQNADNPVIIEDAIEFTTNEGRKYVNLLAYGQNVNIIKSVFYDSNTTWNSSRPYLVMDSVNVMDNSTLQIEEGTTIYFYKNSKMNIYGNIIAKGTNKNPIVFRGHRLDKVLDDYKYDEIAGQWYGINIAPSDRTNQMNNCIIRNATSALETGNIYSEKMCVLDLNNVIIHNNSYSGLYAINSKINATNCQITNSGFFNVFLIAGGEYSFVHCTISNYFGKDYNAKREEFPCLIITNAIQDGELLYYNELTKSDFYNCIIDGSLDNEIIFQIADLADFNFLFENSAIKIDKGILNNFPRNFSNCFFNEKIDYLNSGSYPYDFSPDTLSFIIDKGDMSIVSRFNCFTDILGKSRLADNLPDIGAFEFQKNK